VFCYVSCFVRVCVLYYCDFFISSCLMMGFWIYEMYVRTYVCMLNSEFMLHVLFASFWRLGGMITVDAPNRHHKLNKRQLFIEFPVIWLNNLNFLSAETHFFNSIYSFSCPLDSAGRGGYTTGPSHLRPRHW
jgi:hypothetical protein